MTRRKFITLLGSSLAFPLAARAQQPPNPQRVALIFSMSPVAEMVGPDPINPSARMFVHTLRDLGYVDGRNLILERRSAEGKFERFPTIVRDLVSINTNVIVSTTTPLTLAAKEVTQEVPIVAIMPGSAVELGLIQSLARPGGNVTGVVYGTGPENVAKQIELLKELLPGMSRIAFVQGKGERAWSEQSVQALVRDLGIRILLAEPTSNDYAPAFALIARERVDALLVGAGIRNFGNRQLIPDFATKYRLPAMYQLKEYVASGGLIAYAPDVADNYRRLAAYVDRVLKGARPGDLPVERMTKFALTINLKTAKALGLTVPRADEVID